MPSKDLTFRIFGEDVNASLALRNIAAEADKSARNISKSFGALPMVVTAVFAVATVASVKLAADFQVATTQLVTGAGESEKNIRKISDGLLAMAPAVGMGPTALAKAMFLVESAGYHGADGLRVMKAAAEGAKIGGADATVVANALTAAMVNYNLPAKSAAKVTSELVATVAAGKTNMQDLGNALSVIAKPAAAAGISLEQMLGAMGTMTQQSVSAQQAAQDLKGTIMSLSSPTAVQTTTMAAMGLNSIDVAKNLGKNGLTGTMDTLANAIMQHMGPAGIVLQTSFNESKVNAASANEMLSRMPKSLQKLGQEFLDNTITQKEWTKALKGQDVLTSNLGKEFAVTAKNANGFSESLRTGGGSAKTFQGLLSEMTGGAGGLSVGLSLTGGNMATFKNNVKDISGASVEANGNVKGWALTQKDFKVQIEQATAGVDAMGIKIGTALLPALSVALKIGKDWTDSLTKNKPELYAVLAAVGLLAGGLMALFVAQKVMEAQAILARMALFLLGTANKEGAISAIAQTVATGVQSTAAKAAAIAQAVFSGALYANVAALYSNVTAMLASKAETVALVGLYAKDMVVAVAKSVAGFAISTAAIIGNTVASVAGRVAIIAGTVAMGVATAAQWAFNIALNANPISLIIIAIVALVAGLIYFFTQTKLGKEVWQNMVTAIGVAWNWLWTNVIKPVGDFIGASFKAIYTTVTTVFGAIGSIIGVVFNTVVNGVRGYINIIIDLINGIIKNINGIGGAIKSATGGAIDIKLGTIPRLATGGVTNGPMLAVIGDNPGGREIVQPLSMYKADLAKERAVGAQTSQGKAAQGGFYIDKFITQAGQSPQEIASNLGWMGRWAT